MKMPKGAPGRLAFEKALHLLSLRDCSCKELRSKLADRGYSGAVVDETIRRLIELNYLDDGPFAASRARHLACNKLDGNRRIEADLLHKGISRELIAGAISEARMELDEREGLKRLIRKKIGDRRPDGLDPDDRRRLAQSLLRKGYPAALVYECLGKWTEDFVDDGL